MLGFRLQAPGPFWLEDLAFSIFEESRRLPARARTAACAARGLWQGMRARARILADGVESSLRRETRSAPAPVAEPVPEAEPLDDALAWTLATEPLAAIGPSLSSAVALHRAAAEQLDALTYVLARIRDEVRPLMTSAARPDNRIHVLAPAAQLDTSIEALLELSRRNAATRPARALTAA